ncbi:hypothetical protein A4X06_0g4207 [Tilletia controversa]|uniref:Uncharacterized protein n=2 Tax=Tilletia TaxID=13289 RepID=A0A8X7MTB1_9BASI|nr:hypothetical protein CF336_g6357 [Tilletia laevis]KAE8247767.1 hypothetical protein A4X06_0g4207 [Tilletia controversa]KAE8256550.1 hypothetical protein A4X03_0g5292 [Tilletia caries]
MLRKPELRFAILTRCYDSRPELETSPLVQLAKLVFEVAHGVLIEHGKTHHHIPPPSSPPSPSTSVAEPTAPIPNTIVQALNRPYKPAFPPVSA